MVTITGGGGLEKALTAISKKIGNAASVEIGFMADATYPDGTSVPMVAALDEFGHGSTPPRPFFRKMISEKSPQWGATLAKLLEQNDYDVPKCLALMGEQIKGDLQQSIIDTSAPPLSQLTLLIRQWKKKNPNKQLGGKIIGQLAAKLHEGPQDLSGVSTKPLVESGVMLASVDYRVYA